MLHKLTAARLSKVGDRTELRIDGPPPKPSIIKILDGPFRILLPTELDVDIPHEMISQIVAHVHLLNLAIFILGLDEDILKEVVVMLLHLFIGHIGQMRSVRRFGRILRVDVQILEDDRLRKGRFVVDSGASFAVTTRADLEEEGAIDLVLFGAEDGGQVLRHDGLEMRNGVNGNVGVQVWAVVVPGKEGSCY